MSNFELPNSHFLKLLIFDSSFEKIDKKTLERLDAATCKETLHAELVKLVSRYRMDCYTCHVALYWDITRLRRLSHFQNYIDQNLRLFVNKMQVFDLVFSDSISEVLPSATDYGFLSFVKKAIHRRLFKPREICMELVPIDMIQGVKEIFERFLKEEPKGKLTVSSWTTDKVYERFCDLYDKNQDQETLIELREHLRKIGKTKPPKRNANWYATAFKEHVQMMDTIRNTLDAHPLIFKAAAKNKKLANHLPPVIRVFNDGNYKFLFERDVDSLISTMTKKKSEGKNRESEFERTMSFEKFCTRLKVAGINLESVSLVQQEPPRQIGWIGTAFVGPGFMCISAAHFIDELLVLLIYCEQVWSRLDISDIKKMEAILAEVFKTSAPLDTSFMNMSVRDSILEFVSGALKALCDAKPKRKDLKTKRFRVEPFTGFSETDLRTEIVENLNLAAFYPEIVGFIAPVYEKMLGNRTMDYLNQADLILAVSKCLGKVFQRKLEVIFDGPSDDDVCRIFSQTCTLDSATSSDVMPSKSLRIEHHKEYLTVNMNFKTLRQSHRVLFHRTTSEHIFNNKTGVLYVLATLWHRVCPGKQAPPLDIMYDDLDDVRVFFISEKELICVADVLEVKFRKALETNRCDTNDAFFRLFYIFESEIFVLMINLKTFVKWSPKREIVIRMIAMGRLDFNSATCCFALEVLEAVEILMLQNPAQVSHKHLDILETKRKAWRSRTEWVTVELYQILEFFEQLPIDASRIRFVPEIRDVSYVITRPFVKSATPFVNTIESPKYRLCSSNKRMDVIAFLVTLSSKAILKPKKVDVECSTYGLTRITEAQWNSMVTLDSLHPDEKYRICQNPDTKELLEIATEKEQKTLQDSEAFQVWVTSEFAEPLSSGDMNKVAEWMDLYLKNNTVRIYPDASGEASEVMEAPMAREAVEAPMPAENADDQKPKEVEEAPKPAKDAEDPKSEGEAEDSKPAKDAEGGEDPKLEEAPNPAEEPAEGPEEAKDLAESPEERTSKKKNKKKNRLPFSLTEWNQGFSQQALEKVNSDMRKLMHTINPVTRQRLLMQFSRDLQDFFMNELQHIPSPQFTKEKAALNAELLAKQEKLDEMKVREKKWEKELTAMQKTLSEKERTIGGLEDKIQNFQEQLNRVEEGRKADLAKKDLLKNAEIQKWKDEVEKLEQTYRRKIEIFGELQTRVDRFEADDRARILKLTQEKNMLAAENRELNRRISSVSANPGPSNVPPNIPTHNGFGDQNLMRNETEVVQNQNRGGPRRSRAIQMKLDEFEAMKQRLDREKLLGNAIVVFRDFRDTCAEQGRVERAERKLELYRQKYHGLLNALKTNIRMIKENVAVKMEELKAVPEYPESYELDPEPVPEAVPFSVPDNDCLICLSKMEPMELKTRCNVCRRNFHADCISGWLQRNSTCPVCRSPLPDPNEFPPLG